MDLKLHSRILLILNFQQLIFQVSLIKILIFKKKKKKRLILIKYLSVKFHLKIKILKELINAQKSIF